MAREVDGQRGHSGQRVQPELVRRIESLSPMQARIMDHVRDRPGEVISAIAQGVGCSHNNASRHLDRLCRMGLLVREKEGRGVRHFTTFDSSATRLEPYLEDEKKRQIMIHLAESAHREWVVNELACELGLYHTFLLRFLKRLERRGLVALNKPSARYYCRAKPELVDLLVARGLLVQDDSTGIAKDELLQP